MCPNPRHKHGHSGSRNSRSSRSHDHESRRDLNQRGRFSGQRNQARHGPSQGRGGRNDRDGRDGRDSRRGSGKNENPFDKMPGNKARQTLTPGQMRLTFLGGAEEVGRSCIWLEGKRNYLMDCGIKFESDNDVVPLIDAQLAKKIDAVLLSHAHLDHSGVLPSLYAMGYNRESIMTRPTRDIIQVLLSDALRIAKEKGRTAYTTQNLTQALRKASLLGFGKQHAQHPVTLYDAGHILGSALTLVDMQGKRVLYTGDMNDRPSRMLKPCVQGVPAQTLVMESTYGKRADVHPASADRDASFATSIRETIEEGGKVIVPSFATGRGQEMLLTVDKLIREGLIPKVPVYLDGMVSKVLQIHHDNSAFLSPEAREQIGHDPELFHSKHFKRPRTSDKRDVIEGGPCIIITTSGMLNGGPVLTYLEKLAPDSQNKIILVGYQAEGTRGRELLMGADELTLGYGRDEREGRTIPIRLQVDQAQYSAHADHNGLVRFALNTPKLERVFLVHGEDKGPIELREALEEAFQARARKVVGGVFGHEPKVTVPQLGESFSI